jgi:hypothetical protein
LNFIQHADLSNLFSWPTYFLGQLIFLAKFFFRPRMPGVQLAGQISRAIREVAVATSVGLSFTGSAPPHHFTAGQIIAITAAVVIPAVVVPIVTRGSHPAPVVCKNLATAC